MLNRAKLLRELEQISGDLFADLSHEFDAARASWQRIADDPAFLYKIQTIQTQIPLPIWIGAIDASETIAKPPSHYCVIAVDGSQIYPDRHQGTSCFLLNIGTVIFNYGLPGKNVSLDSIPSVFLDNKEKKVDHISPDFINLRREELEFEAGVSLAQQWSKERAISSSSDPLLLLWDGSLIFWHLESKDPTIRNLFLPRYLASLYELYQATILNAAYISLPKNKELVNLLKAELSNGNLENTDSYSGIEHIIDAHIATFFLKPAERTTLFKHRSKTAAYYPEPLKPYFFYLNTGSEIVRIEIPAWIAQNSNAISTISQIIYDQTIKGRGYPVALAEAHEQAVVKGADRDFFYHLITKLGIHHKQQAKLSHKLLKKRSLGI